MTRILPVGFISAPQPFVYVLAIFRRCSEHLDMLLLHPVTLDVKLYFLGLEGGNRGSYDEEKTNDLTTSSGSGIEVMDDWNSTDSLVGCTLSAVRECVGHLVLFLFQSI